MDDQSNLRMLSFVNGSAAKVDLWPTFRTTGSYAGDNEAGRARAEEVVTYMRDHDAPMLLGHIVQAIVASGSYGGLEVGFFGHFGVILVTAPVEAAMEESPADAGEATNVVSFSSAAVRRAAG